ncbi:MAG: glycosyltransferase [Clostridia bacterium]|nr:glycosyltransferase [Clostridia bacterium]
MGKKLVSVIIPIYNMEKFLDRTVKSVVESDYDNLEIILVDDGSTDNSLDLCKIWEGKDSRIKIIHKENGGASSARNAGIKASTGDYIAFVDSDDIVEKMMYSKLISLIEKTYSDIGWCSYDTNGALIPVGKKTETVIEKEQIKQNAILPFFGIVNNPTLLNTYNSIFNKVVRGSIIRKNKIYFREDLRIGEDSEYITRLLMKSNRIVFCEEPLYHYMTQNDNSLTRTCMTDLFSIKVKRYEIFKSICEEYVNTTEKRAEAFFRYEIECLNHYSIFLGLSEFSKCVREIWDCEYVKDAYKSFYEKSIPIVGKRIAFAHKINCFFLYCLIAHQKNRILRTKRFICKIIKK